MAKRKLNQQQKSRISKRQAALCDEATSNGAKPRGDKSRDIDDGIGEELQGLVISHYRAHADVEFDGDVDGDGDGDKHRILRCNLRANLPPIVTGDRVTWRRSQKDASAGIVEAIHERTSELCRPDSYGKMKLVGANITRAIIVMAPEPIPHANLIDRYLIIAENLGIEALLLWNKSDLASSDELIALKEAYQKLGYPSLEISSLQATGMPALREQLATGCSIFVGQSGVGKSSIIQALLPDEDIKIGALSSAAKKGRHTTTHARLYHFPTGGDCIDSPGIREFGLWHLSAEDVLHGFVEFQPFIGQCKFRNCTHIDDKYCAIIQAVNSGDITPARYQSFVMITQSLDQVAIQNQK